MSVLSEVFIRAMESSHILFPVLENEPRSALPRKSILNRKGCEPLTASRREWMREKVGGRAANRRLRQMQRLAERA